MDEPQVKELPERLAMSTVIPLKIQSAPFQILQHRYNRYSKYQSSAMYIQRSCMFFAGWTRDFKTTAQIRKDKLLRKPGTNAEVSRKEWHMEPLYIGRQNHTILERSQ